MLKRTRALLAAGAAGLLVVAAAGSAVGNPWGDIDCEQFPGPWCDIGVGEGDGGGSGGGGGGSGSNPPGGGGGGGGGSGEPEVPPRDRVIGEPENLAECQYVPVDYEPPSDVIVAREPAASRSAVTRTEAAALALPAADVPPPDGGNDAEGQWYVWRCTGEGFTDALWRLPVWIPNEDLPDGSRGPSVLEVAQRAYAQLYIRAPEIGVSPAAEQLVQLPTWLWLDPEGWTPISATASVPGVSITATAVPQSASWAMGDGATVSCDGPGTPFSTGDDPAVESPDCGHTYTSAAERREVTSTVEWTVTWAGAGQSGEFPGLMTTSTADVRVVESQALTTN